ncbi:MAG: DUF1501 domain-containing protein [Planctomycetaceae bacterium]|nr:DUF1501 domain-containing protein [Planctomycetaceae bacterium]
MTASHPVNSSASESVSRRSFLSGMGTGLGSIALASMLQQDGLAQSGHWSPPTGLPHFAPKAKSVIWLFMVGGVSQVETFDPKPALNKYGGMTIAETPHTDVLDSPYIKNRVELVQGDANGAIYDKLYPMQVGHRPRGESGLEISDWWPHLGDCADDLAIVRSMWTTASNHDAQLQFHTGRNRFDGFFPTIGSWVHYGLGSLNDSLPQFIVLGDGIGDCCGGKATEGADYLGPEHDGVTMSVDPKNPLPFAIPTDGATMAERARSQQLLGRLNRLAGEQYPNDPALEARIKSYELAFRMQTAVPEVVNLEGETQHIHQLYGTEGGTTQNFGRLCLTARRLVERGVRFVQIYHGGGGGAGRWDAHSNVKGNHSGNCAQVDQPIAGLLKDLKQRGLLDETLVVWGSEFGRTPGLQGANGRGHHNFGFSVWMAGGGIKGGIAHGATDELGFHAVENRHYVTDLHATVMQQLGLDPRALAVPGRKRLEIDYGTPIDEVIA